MQENLAVTDTNYNVPSHVPGNLVHPFDLFNDPEMSSCPFGRVEKLRQHGRIFWNPTNPDYNGSWVITHAEDLRFVFSNPQIFTSKNKLSGFRANDAENPLVMIPLELDGISHGKFRDLISPLFTPSAIAKLVDGVNERAIELVESVRLKGECEFMSAFGNPFPVSIFMQFMGLPQEDTALFMTWVVDIQHKDDNAARAAASAACCNFLMNLAAERRAKPAGDLVSYIVAAQLDGRSLTDIEVMGILYLFFLAGLDTVSSTLSWFYHHLATHPDQQQKLRENPQMIDKAVEEMLRRYSIVVPHRMCTQDTEIGGVKVKAGDWVTVITGLGSTDPCQFADPLDVNFDRKNSRAHLAFAYGAHFCMGLHLARRELQASLREWLARIPMWRLKPGAPMKAHGGFVFAYDYFEIEWDVVN
jgi:cytochrome P450